jgi:hypothetical protein
MIRLLRWPISDSLTFEEFDEDDEILRYGILSHTWGSPDQEVSYQDLGAGRASRLDGLEYFWVDTCCTIQVKPR